MSFDWNIIQGVNVSSKELWCANLSSQKQKNWMLVKQSSVGRTLMCFLWVEELVFFLASFIAKKKQKFVKSFIKAVLKCVRVYVVAGTLHKPGVRCLACSLLIQWFSTSHLFDIWKLKWIFKLRRKLVFRYM